MVRYIDYACSQYTHPYRLNVAILTVWFKPIKSFSLRIFTFCPSPLDSNGYSKANSFPNNSWNVGILSKIHFNCVSIKLIYFMLAMAFVFNVIFMKFCCELVLDLHCLCLKSWELTELFNKKITNVLRNYNILSVLEQSACLKKKKDYFSVFTSNKIEMFPVTHSKSVQLLCQH